MTYVVIDAEKLTFVGKSEDYTGVRIMEDTVLADRGSPAIVCQLGVGSSWSQLTEMEAGMLCRNHGIDFVMIDYSGNLKRIQEYAERLEPTVFTPEQIELFNKPAQDLRDKYGGQGQPKAIVSDSKPKAQPQARPPSSKGATGRVWAIADTVVGSNLAAWDIKELRKAVIQACVDAEIHPATAATQWSKWKKDKGL